MLFRSLYFISLIVVLNPATIKEEQKLLKSVCGINQATQEAQDTGATLSVAVVMEGSDSI